MAETQPPACRLGSDIDSEILDSLPRDWIITLELERTSLPKVCRPKLVVTDRPGSGKYERDELLLTYVVVYELGRNVQPAVSLPIEEPSEASESSDETDTSSTERGLDSFEVEEGDFDSHEVDEHDFDSHEVDEHTWPDHASFQEDESNTGDSFESRSTTPNEDEVCFERKYPANLNDDEQHIFAHSKLDGLVEWRGDLVTVIVGHQKIPFIVPTFVLTDNFEFFRAVFEVGRWLEGTKHTVTLEEESPVDFVLLLRFLVHNTTQDFDEIVDASYPFSLASNPLRPSEEYAEAVSIAPWIIRVVALAERLCFKGPASRLTGMLDATLKPLSTDRVSPALMDWLFDNSAEESVLRSYVYDRLLQSLIKGDVDPMVYKPYAESDPELMTLLLTGLLEHPLVVPIQGWQLLFAAQCKSRDNDALVSKRSRLVHDCFDLAWCMFARLHRYIHDITPSCVGTEHVWDTDNGWVGCKGVCVGCWNKDLGGNQKEIACVLP